MTLSEQPDGEPFGRYRLLEQIGAGGMAVVYRAVAESAEGPKTVVIKRVLPDLSRDPQFVQMLVAEARLSLRLSHPGIVQVHELGRIGTEYFLSMEHVDGIDLVRVFNRCIQLKTPLPIGLVCLIVQRIGAALDYAHRLTDTDGRALEIIHRDVSPANIMVTFDGTVKLLDFGVAKAAEHARDERTRTGTLKGKINYLSPEQAEGLAIDRRADVFALGIVFHEALTLKRLFRAESDLVTLRMVRQCDVTAPSKLREGLDPALDAIVLKMLARDPSQRYASCDEIVKALEPFVIGEEADEAALRTFLQQLAPFPGVKLVEEGAPEAEVIEMESEPTALVSDRPDVAGVKPPAEVTSQVVAPKRRRLALPGGAALVLMGGIALGAVALRSGRHHAPPPPLVVAPVVAPPSPPAPAAEKPGHLSIEVDVTAARILLDGEVVADATHRAQLTVAHPGEHVLQVIAPRRKPYQRSVLIPSGGNLELAVKLERASASSTGKTRPRPRGENYLVDPFGPHR